MLNIILDGFPEEYEGYLIRTDFRVGMQISEALNDVDLAEPEKMVTALRLLYGNGIPPDSSVAESGLRWFMAGGNVDEERVPDGKPPTFDFEQDNRLLYSAFRARYGIDLTRERLHWFAFLAMLGDIGGCSLSDIMPKIKARNRWTFRIFCGMMCGYKGGAVMGKRRPSGDGMVRKREDGRWEGRIVVGHKNNGNPIYRYVLAKTQAELTQKLHDMIEIYRDADLSEDCNMLLSEWLNKWINEYITCYVRPNTLFSYTAMIKNQINPHLGNRPLSALTTQEIQKFYNAIKKNSRVKTDKNHGTALADSMVRKVHMMLHEALNMAVKQKLIVNNPTNGTTLPKNNYAPKQILNDKQLDKFMNQIRQDKKWHDFFYTEITTGLRKGEICGLRWDDFDERIGTLKIKRSIGKTINGVMLIGETKTETGSREILLPPSTAELLRKRKEDAISDWIFPNLRNTEKPMNPQCAYQHLKTILKRAGLPSIRFHDLRHTFATHAIAGGVDAKTLSGILGHANASFTLDNYTHVTTDMKKSAARIVGNFMDEIIGGVENG